MEIQCIIKQSPGDLQCFDTTYKTLDVLKSTIDINDKITLCIKDVDDREYGLDFLAMLVYENTISSATSWDEVAAALTSLMITLYTTTYVAPPYMYYVDSAKVLTKTTPVTSTSFKYPTMYSCEHNYDIAVSYGTRKDPTLRNNKNIKWMLRDIIYTYKSSARPVDLTQCLPVINGVLFYPKIFNNELFAYDGADVLGTSGAKGLVLIDMEPCGGMDVVRFSDCTNTYAPANQRITTVLPETKSLIDKTLLLVVGGRFIFNHEISITSDRSFSVDLDRINLRDILLSNKVLKEEFEFNTGIVRNISYDEYVQGIFAADHYESYIVILNCEHLYRSVAKPLLTLNKQKIYFPPNGSGLLMNKYTREIVDYTRIMKNHTTFVSINNLFEPYVIRKQNPESAIDLGYIFSNGTKRGIAKNLCSGSYELVNMFTE